MNAFARSASILTVGTEITSGDILNSNAQWLSEKLTALGLDVLFHFSVRDERSEIMKALGFLESSSRFLFVSGGLGPTSDDFTRDVISDWLKAPLEFNPDEFAKIKNMLEERQVQVRDGHKNEALFPTGSLVLNNPVGTAPGFMTNTSKQIVFVLPGPPKEIQGIWPELAEKHLKIQIPKVQDSLHFFRFIGRPESDVAEFFENLIRGHDVTIAYRASVPYVLVKIKMPMTQNHLIAQWKKSIEEAFGDSLLRVDAMDPLEDLVSHTSKNFKVEVRAQSLRGELVLRMAHGKTQVLAGPTMEFESVTWGSGTQPVLLTIAPQKEGWAAGFEDEKGSLTRAIVPPERYRRGGRFASQFALAFAVEFWLETVKKRWP